MKYIVEPSINEFLKSDDRAHCVCDPHCGRYGCHRVLMHRS